MPSRTRQPTASSSGELAERPLPPPRPQGVGGQQALGQTVVEVVGVGHDDDGDVVVRAVHDGDRITRADVQSAITPLTGAIAQVPSAVSAIKVDGKRSYARVRAGEDVELAAREVVVSRFEIDAFRQGEGVLDVDVTVECSSGTYVRALARDLGAALGVGGHLTALRRTRVGPFGLDRARTLEQLGEHFSFVGLDEAIKAVAEQAKVEDYEIRTVPEAKSFLEQLLAGLLDEKDKDEQKLGAPGLSNLFLETAAPALRAADPRRVRLVRQAAQQLDLLQQEGVMLTMPLYDVGSSR